MRGEFDKAIQLLTDYLAGQIDNVHDVAICAYTLSESYRLKEDTEKEKAFETVKSARKVLNNLYYEVRTAAYNVNTRKIPYAQACDDGLPGSGLWGDKFHSGSWTPDDDPNMGDDNSNT